MWYVLASIYSVALLRKHSADVWSVQDRYLSVSKWDFFIKIGQRCNSVV